MFFGVHNILSAESVAFLFAVPFLGERIGIERKTCEGFSYFDSFNLKRANMSFHKYFIEEPFEIDEAVRKGVCKGDDIIFVVRLILKMETVIIIVFMVLAGD